MGMGESKKKKRTLRNQGTQQCWRPLLEEIEIERKRENKERINKILVVSCMEYEERKKDKESIRITGELRKGGDQKQRVHRTKRK